MHDRFRKVLTTIGFSDERAGLCSRLFAEASLDGYDSHGLNRFPTFVEGVCKGIVDPQANPGFVSSFGVLERWNGHRGPGNLNAFASMNRAITLAKEHGIGCVALSHTNHWMRAGAYGWQAADEGCIGICWTNTLPNMPPWGAKEVKIGNNPLVVAVPRENGHLVLDVAMSQFSFGQLGTYLKLGKQLPVAGGYNKEGNLTNEPEAVAESRRALPIGFWKGSGLAIMLDLIAALLSGGLTTFEIGQNPGEQDVSQVFMAIYPGEMPDQEEWKRKMEDVIADLHTSIPAEESVNVQYPGEGALLRRAENLRLGIRVDEEIWERVLAMSGGKG
jgi:3-dehydro-L-gulonate 2-dehydrogenase